MNPKAGFFALNKTKQRLNNKLYSPEILESWGSPDAYYDENDPYEFICCGRKRNYPVIVSEQDVYWLFKTGYWLVTHNASSGYAYKTLPDFHDVLLWMHKAILYRAYGPPPDKYHMIGDHINGNRLDNRRCNLRWASWKMNVSNRHGKAWRDGYGQPDSRVPIIR